MMAVLFAVRDFFLLENATFLLSVEEIRAKSKLCAYFYSTHAQCCRVIFLQEFHAAYNHSIFVFDFWSLHFFCVRNFFVLFCFKGEVHNFEHSLRLGWQLSGLIYPLLIISFILFFFFV